LTIRRGQEVIEATAGEVGSQQRKGDLQSKSNGSSNRNFGLIFSFALFTFQNSGQSFFLPDTVRFFL
jgi:hypothetical protein